MLAFRCFIISNIVGNDLCVVPLDYAFFSEEYNCTVNEFVISSRIDIAKKLLRETKQSVMSIAEEVGITNYTYFCKLFKKHVGISPYKYRK